MSIAFLCAPGRSKTVEAEQGHNTTWDYSIEIPIIIICKIAKKKKVSLVWSHLTLREHSGEKYYNCPSQMRKTNLREANWHAPKYKAVMS